MNSIEFLFRDKAIERNGISLYGTITLGHANVFHPNGSTGVQVSFRPGGYTLLAVIIWAGGGVPATVAIPMLAK